MVFFTRSLYSGVQPDSGWERKAEREWYRRDGIYQRYYEVIAPLLPATVRRLCSEGLHDAEVESVAYSDGAITFVIDATYALGGFSGRRWQISFTGLHRRVPLRGLRGQTWLYSEAHLSSKARFSFHVLFVRGEIEIEADNLSIKRVAR